MFSKITACCSEISGYLKSGSFTEASAKFDELFRILLQFQQRTNTALTRLQDENEKKAISIEALKIENARLSTLVSSGITFSTKLERNELIETALDVVVKELRADAGFVTLIDERGGIDSVYSRNDTVSSNPEVLEVSTSVIRATLSSLKPQKIEDTKTIKQYAKQQSIFRLGISSVLCVPLADARKVYGAVYLDRRDKDFPFEESDLNYLLSFASQIVKGLEVSKQFDSLEKKLISESPKGFDDLRSSFSSSNIIGKSKVLFDVLRIASRVSESDASLLITGESGTGKNLLAQAIHSNSRRRDKPFFIVDCSSIPHDLLESELFGYESGAFTGANKSKAGKIELANGGTLFLDEIGEMNINIQPKLLRVIQTKEFERLGGVKSIKVDVRIIAATNKNLAEQITAGNFREDLYYRLKVIELNMPPLRERKEDIELLVEYFMKKHTPQGATLTLSDSALQMLEEYNWPGNIRELENVILRCCVLAKGPVIDIQDLPPELISEEITSDPIMNEGTTLEQAENNFRRAYILKVLRKTKSKSEAAKVLGVNRTHLYKIMAQLGIEEN